MPKQEPTLPSLLKTLEKLELRGKNFNRMAECLGATRRQRQNGLSTLSSHANLDSRSCTDQKDDATVDVSRNVRCGTAVAIKTSTEVIAPVWENGILTMPKPKKPPPDSPSTTPARWLRSEGESDCSSLEEGCNSEKDDSTGSKGSSDSSSSERRESNGDGNADSKSSDSSSTEFTRTPGPKVSQSNCGLQQLPNQNAHQQCQQHPNDVATATASATPYESSDNEYDELLNIELRKVELQLECNVGVPALGSNPDRDVSCRLYITLYLLFSANSPFCIRHFISG